MNMSIPISRFLSAAVFGVLAVGMFIAIPSFAHAQYYQDLGASMGYDYGGYSDPGYSDPGMWGGSDSVISDYPSYTDSGMWGSDLTSGDYSSYNDPNMWGGTDLTVPDTCYSCGTFDTAYSYPTYDTATPSYDYGYPSSYGSSYSYPYSSGSYYMPSIAAAYSYPSYTPSYTTPSRTDIFAPTNTTIANNGNSCTAGNSCNTTISSPTTISYNNAGGGSSYYPVYYPSYPSYPTYSYPTYQNPAPTCYITVSPNYASPGQAVTITWSATNATYGTISNIGAVSMSGSRTIYPYQTTTYNGSFSGPGGSTNCYATVTMQTYAAPYVTLSQVPYTGLDLGPVGNALYWLFLVLWCAIGAYLVTVKKVQNKLMHRLHAFLTGDGAPRHPVYQRTLQPASAPAPQSNVDSFIMSQVNRNK